VRRTLVVIAALFAVVAVAPLAHAGEVTGNGKLLHFDGKWGTGLHARSACAYSGQEDLQYFTDDGDGTAKDPITKGDPGHAQSWGQIPKSVRDTMPAELHPGMSCNPTRSTFGEP
jgi:hypothetical protein